MHREPPLTEIKVQGLGRRASLGKPIIVVLELVLVLATVIVLVELVIVVGLGGKSASLTLNPKP